MFYLSTVTGSTRYYRTARHGWSPDFARARLWPDYAAACQHKRLMRDRRGHDRISIDRDYYGVN